MRTLPVLRTAMMISLGFLLLPEESGGGGLEGCAASSVMRIWHDSMMRRFSSSNRSARDMAPGGGLAFGEVGLIDWVAHVSGVTALHLIAAKLVRRWTGHGGGGGGGGGGVGLHASTRMRAELDVGWTSSRRWYVGKWVGGQVGREVDVHTRISLSALLIYPAHHPPSTAPTANVPELVCLAGQRVCPSILRLRVA
ncbi:hypothetical protein KC340_g35 [Hortaea werneckii]|nr:hypothetical protein KC340_g35 [Hortaea werneckii]